MTVFKNSDFEFLYNKLLLKRRACMHNQRIRMNKKLAAGLFGTFWLVFGGCGSAVLAAGFPTLGIEREQDHEIFTPESMQTIFSRLP